MFSRALHGLSPGLYVWLNVESKLYTVVLAPPPLPRGGQRISNSLLETRGSAVPSFHVKGMCIAVGGGRTLSIYLLSRDVSSLYPNCCSEDGAAQPKPHS